MDFATAYLHDVRALAATYRRMAEDAIAQVDDAQFATALGDGENSIAILVKHMAGNLRSRWTDFLSSDGEKPHRDRDGEFEVHGTDDRAALLDAWDAGWTAFTGTLDTLTPAELGRTIHIRGEPHTVLRAVNRALAHACSHMGQIVMLARHFAGAEWRTLSIPRGESRPFTADTTQQHGP